MAIRPIRTCRRRRARAAALRSKWRPDRRSCSTSRVETCWSMKALAARGVARPQRRRDRVALTYCMVQYISRAEAKEPGEVMSDDTSVLVRPRLEARRRAFLEAATAAFLEK